MKASRYIAFVLAILIICCTVFTVPLKTKAEINPVQDYFLRVIGSAARASYYESDVLASLTIGQAIYESGWGCSNLAVGGRNLFGIKAFSSWTGKVFNQRDMVFYNSYEDYLFASGQTHVNTTSAWRAHATWLESVKSHNTLFVSSDRYESIVGEKSYKTAANLLVPSGYCTDPNYAKTVIGIIEDNNLTEYDNITPDSDGIVALVAEYDRKFLEIGETFVLGVTYVPSNKTPSYLKWKSDNPSVATVDSNGKVKAVGHGTAFITATLANGREACCIVYVDCNAIVIESDVNVRTSASSTASSEGVVRRGSAIKVTSNEPISGDSGNRFYTVKGVTKDGETVTGYIDERYIYLSNRNPDSIKVVKDNITLAVNDKYTVYNIVTPGDAVNQTLTWKSSNTSVATVSSKGVITALKQGKSIVTATAVGGAKVDITVNVASSRRNYPALISAYQSVVVRENADSSSDSLGRIAFMEKVTVIGEPYGIYYMVQGVTTSGNTVTGYIDSNYVKIIPDGVTVTYGTAGEGFGIYASPNTNSRRYVNLSKGTKYAVIGKSGDWSYVLGLAVYEGTISVFGYSPLGNTVTNETNEPLSIKETVAGYKGKTTGNVNIRSGAGTNYTSVGTVVSGTDLTVIGKAIDGWYKVALTLNSKSVVGYCSADYVTLLQTGKTTSKLNLRNSASTSSPIVTQIPLGDTVSILGENENGWYRVDYNNGSLTYSGYCSADYIVLDERSVSVTVNAVGSGLTYKWYFRDKNSDEFVKTDTFKSNTYKITMDSSRAGREVYCIVTDKDGNTKKSDVVTLTMGTAFQITKQPTSVGVKNGETAKVSLNANGDGLTYKWYFKDKTDSAFKLTNTFKGNSYGVAVDGTRSGRKVYCVITDEYGNSQKSDTVILSVAPTISKQPTSVSVQSGKTAKVSVIASGEGLSYKWYIKDKNSSKFGYTGTFTGNSYSVTMNATRAGRQVYCVITDKYGNSVKTDTVVLGMAAKITTQPTSVSVQSGKTAKVSVIASGEGLSYKWYIKDKNSSKFGYTGTFTGNSYSVTMDSTRAGRQVYCVITDKYGNSVKTNTVTLNKD